MASDPLLIGYFISNEPLLEDVPKLVPALKASECPSKASLLAMLETKYGDVAAFNAAWKHLARLLRRAAEQPLTVTTRPAADDMAEFFRLFLETRYNLVNTALRKHDPNHLLIGDRWMPGTANSEVLVKTAAKYLDVISINYYTYGIDKRFLDRIHGWAKKPLLFSEFYYAAADQGLQGGSKVEQPSRTRAGLPELCRAVGGHRLRGRHPMVSRPRSGLHWPVLRGFNGEAANTGLVNVADRPYKDFLTEVMKTNYTIYDVDPRPPAAAGARRSRDLPPSGPRRQERRDLADGQLVRARRLASRWPSVPRLRNRRRRPGPGQRRQRLRSHLPPGLGRREPLSVRRGLRSDPPDELAATRRISGTATRSSCSSATRTSTRAARRGIPTARS